MLILPKSHNAEHTFVLFCVLRHYTYIHPTFRGLRFKIRWSSWHGLSFHVIHVLHYCHAIVTCTYQWH